MSETGDGTPVLPLWPAAEYAERCADGDWASYQAREIDLEEALDEMLPMLRARRMQPGVFFSPDSGSINATPDEMERDLRAELSKYE